MKVLDDHCMVFYSPFLPSRNRHNVDNTPFALAEEGQTVLYHSMASYCVDIYLRVVIIHG